VREHLVGADGVERGEPGEHADGDLHASIFQGTGDPAKDGQAMVPANLRLPVVAGPRCVLRP
jgi:hypothetical protein